MVWQRTDDQYGVSRKVTRISRKPIEVPTRLAAVGLDHLAMNYSVRHHTDGVIDMTELDELMAMPELIDALVAVDRWHLAGHDCARCIQPPEGSIVIHDFLVYNPDSATVAAGNDAKRAGALLANHNRWHVKGGISVATCSLCVISEATGKRVTKGVASESLRNPPSPSPIPDKDRQTVETPVEESHEIPARADQTDEEFLVTSAGKLGIKRLNRVVNAFAPIVGAIDSPMRLAFAVDVAGAVLDLATRHVRYPERYLEQAARQSPDVIRDEWKRVAENAPAVNS
jgi:hypothetical protein